MTPNFVMAACTGTWYDVVTPAETDVGDGTGGQYTRVSNGTSPSGFYIPVGGQVQALRAFVGSSLYNNGFKGALYDSSGNLVTSGTISLTIGTDIYETVDISSPPTISAGTYSIAFNTNGNGFDLVYRRKSGYVSGTSYINFTGSYADFPPSTIPANEGYISDAYAFGVCVLPAETKVSPKDAYIMFIGFE